MGKKAASEKKESAIKRRPLKEILADNTIEKKYRSTIEANYETSLYPEMFYTIRDFEAARKEQHIQNKQDYHRDRQEIIDKAENDAKP